MGGEEGSSEACLEIGGTEIPCIKRNAQGTPLLSDAFAQADARASGTLLCYVNADILLFDDFMPAISSVRGQAAGEFLVTGRRWNFDAAAESSDFHPADFRRMVAEQGKLYDEFNMDYFVFPRGLFAEIPDFAVGRPGWDNWLVYEARRRGVRVIDATSAIMAGHQNHDYAHTSEGRKGGKAAVWSGAEASANRSLARGRLFDLRDATHILTASREVVPRRDFFHWWRRRTVAHEIYPRWSWLLRPLAALDDWFRRTDHAVRFQLLRHGVDLFPHKEKRAGQVLS